MVTAMGVRLKQWLLGAVCLTMGSAAQAYVDPSFYVIRQISRRHAPIDEVRIRSRLAFYKKSGEMQRAYTEVLGLDNFSRSMVQVFDAEGVEVGSKSRAQLSTERARPIPYDLLFARDFSLIFERFKSLGLPLRTEQELYSEKEGILPYKPEPWVNLMRFEDDVMLVIGDFKERTPQLWVTKPNRALLANSVPAANAADGYLPVRAVFTTSFDGSSGVPLEFRFRNRKEYRGAESRAFSYPARIEAYKDGYLWVTLEAQDVHSGNGASHLDAAHVKADADGETKDLLEQYFAWLR